jgi:hypothetical protein
MSSADPGGRTVVTPLERDELVIRLRDISRRTLARSYDVLDPQQRPLASIVQRTGGPAAVLRRQLASSPLGLNETFDLVNGSSVVLLHINRHREGRRNRALVADVRLTDETPVCIATSASGSDGPYTITDAAGDELGEAARGGRTLFVIAATGGGPLGRIDLEANTFAPREAGAAHPSSYRVRFHADAPMPVRMGTAAVLVAFDSVQGP